MGTHEFPDCHRASRNGQEIKECPGKPLPVTPNSLRTAWKGYALEMASQPRLQEEDALDIGS